MDLRKKITILGVTQLVAVAGILLFLYAQEAKEKVRNQYVEKARAVVLTTESTREEMGKKWDQGILTAEGLREWADDGDIEKVLAGVPVVTAWRAAMARAEEGGYEFRVPKFDPRNPKNEPDPLEARVIRMLEEQGLAEHYEIDESMNAVRYFRPIRLTQECMLCHGDPATSQALWGNDQGLDPTGAKMENWQVGEVHGAFEVVQSLDAADAQIAASIYQAGGVIGALIVVGGIVFFIFSNRGINGLYRPIRQIAGALNEGADQVSDASQQVAASSQSLAASASEQASSLEETSAALEEMAAITRTNAENSTKANDLTRQAQQAADDGSVVVNELNQAMQGISDASQQINKIIKVIEEIAFQTNLLALNAAVEAARAGEHGKGFAVVADEVRSLAQRAAGAANEIAELITNSTERSAEGVKIADNVSNSLGGILENVRSVSDLIDGIATASSEQSQGVDQINSAVSQMDGNTQRNASTAEESASASEQLSAQAVSVKDMVVQLLGLVGAGKSVTGGGAFTGSPSSSAGGGAANVKRRLGFGKKQSPPAGPATSSGTGSAGTTHAAPAAASSGGDADTFIPMGDEDQLAEF
jgi:methyl-accepting chemotaxis protein